MYCDVMVIGAGLSGLSAAKLLVEAGINVIVLEAMDRVGGRTLTKRDPKVNYVDLGGSYVGPTQDRILRLSKELGIETYCVNVTGDLLHYKNGKQTRSDPSAEPGRRNPLMNMDMNNIYWLIDKMGEEIPAEAPWTAPKAEEWDLMTYKEFLEKHCWTQDSVDYFNNVVKINMALESYEASLLSVLWYIKQCGGMKRMHSTANGAQERKFKGGSQQISEKIAENLGSERVLINNPVIGIDQNSKEIVIVKTLNGKEFKAKYIILACPPIVQMKIHFQPPLPPLRNQLMQRLPMGTCMKVILYYSKAFWIEKGLTGCFVVEGDDSHPMFTTMDDSKPDGSHPALIGFIHADKCRRLFSLTREERRTLLARSLAEASGCEAALKPSHYEEKNWMEEQYIGGCYTAIYPPGCLTRYGRIIREPIDRLFFAGTETATKWSGYMDGAIEAGERAAREILHKMGMIRRDQIWQKEPQSEDVIPQPFKDTYSEKYTPSVPGFFKLIILTLILGIATAAFLKQLHY